MLPHWIHEKTTLKEAKLTPFYTHKLVAEDDVQGGFLLLPVEAADAWSSNLGNFVYTAGSEGDRGLDLPPVCNPAWKVLLLSHACII